MVTLVLPQGSNYVIKIYIVGVVGVSSVVYTVFIPFNSPPQWSSGY